MCDTIGRIIDANHALFAKNSDRSANEPQIIEFIEHKIHDEKELKCTYITIEQVKETNALVLSRPIWLWGGEMGVNEHGVCIGNEAVFTKGKYGKDSLIGMDYLRLALERGNSAYQALNIIIELLEKYDQGGNCGFDKDFHYDNSFLIMDRKEIYVLETVGKNWAYKKYDHASISNRLTLEDDCDKYKEERCNFKKKYSDFLFSTFSFAKKRQQTTFKHKFDDIYDAFNILRCHDNDNPMAKGTVSSVCMHSGDLFADQTTSSMVIELTDEIKIYVTGSSRPCLAIFKPFSFKADGLIFKENDPNAVNYWKNMERRQRQLLGKVIPEDYYQEKEQLEKMIIANPTSNFMELEDQFYQKWDNYPFAKAKTALGFNSFWKKKNEAFYINDVYAPIKGVVKKIEECSDPTFSKKLLGDGFMIEPLADIVCAPVSGTITMIFPTKHAFGIKTKNGKEILVHIGIDTVNLKGKYFEQLVDVNKKVKVGTPIIRCDFNQMKKQGYNTDVIVVITKEENITLTNVNIEVNTGTLIVKG